MTSILLAVLCAQTNPDDGIVTLKRKSFTWAFARIPEGRTKVEGQDVDIPSQLHVTWSALDPKAPLTPANVFATNVQTHTVEFFQPGKRYENSIGGPETLLHTRRQLSELAQAMLERFFEFDLEFPGGTWEELARAIKDRLAAAWAQQKPDLLKGHLPDKIEIDISTRPEYQVRYPVFQAKAITLAQLNLFGLSPLLDVREESTPRVIKDAGGNLSVTVDTTPLLGQWILADGNLVNASTLEIAFFNLGDRPALRAEDVVALFEMAWKAGGRPVFARVKYHPETKIIMLQAMPEEVVAAQRAFASLTGRALRAEPPISQNPFDNISATLEKIAELIEKQGEKDKDK